MRTRPASRSEASEPVLILTDAEYRRAFSSPVEERPAGRRIAVDLLFAAVSMILIVWSAGALPEPQRAAPPLAAVADPRPLKAPEPSIPDPAPAPPPPRAAVVAEPPVEEEPPPAVIAPAAQPAPWLGGRVWVRLRLRMERASQAQESERRVILAAEGSRFLLERSDGADLWLDRLELLLQLPAGDESWRREVTRSGTDFLHLPRGDMACRVVEGEDRFPQGIRRFRYWYSDEFPAGAVRAEQTLGEVEFACRVLDFGPAPSRKP
jgi:hypothetical protein